MPVGYTHSQGGLVGQFGGGLAEGLGSGLGREAAKGLGALAGMGAKKLGIGGPSREMIDYLKSQGLSESDAYAFAEMEPRAQQQVLENIGKANAQQQTSAAYEGLGGMGAQGMPQGAGAEQQQQAGAQQPGAPEPINGIEPVFMPKPTDIYAYMKQSGLDSKQAKDYTTEYRKDYDKDLKAADDYIAEVKKDAKGAKGSNSRLDRMYELVKKGDLAPAVASTIIDTIEKGINGIVNIGIDLHSVMNGDSQEFNKLSKDFIKEAKNYFGSRVTDNDIKLLLKTVPDLAQSDEAKLRVINNLKTMNEAALLKSRAIKEIKTQYGGRTPSNMEELVDAKIGKELDVLAEKLKKGESIIPDYEESIKKARGTTGELPSTAAGAGIGGLLGSAAGPIGTVLGGLAGGAIGSYAPRALKAAQEGSSRIEKQLGIPDITQLLGSKRRT